MAVVLTVSQHHRRGRQLSWLLAEYRVIPAFNANPDNISDDLASIFDPFGNAAYGCLSIWSVKMYWYRGVNNRRNGRRGGETCRRASCGDY